MFITHQRRIAFLFSILTSSLSFTCLKDLAADKALEKLLLQSTQEQAATLSTLPSDIIDILKHILIDKNRELLTQLLPLKSKKLKGHTQAIASVAFSPDGNFALTASNDNTARIWNLNTLESKELKGHRYSVCAVACSPDGNYALTASEDTIVRLWNLKTLQFKKLSGHTDRVRSVAFSPDGNYALTGSCDGTARLWNLKTLESKELKGHQSAVMSVAFSCDGNYALTASYDDNTVRLWNLKTLESRELNCPTEKAKLVAFSPDANYVLTAVWDSCVHVYLRNVNTLELKKLKDPKKGAFDSVACSPNGNYALMGLFDSTASLWNLKTLDFKKLHGHTRKVSSVAFSPDGNYALTGSTDYTARLWHMPCLEKLTIEQLLFIMKLSQSPLNLNNLQEQQILESFKSAIGTLPRISNEDYSTNPLVKAYIDLKRRHLLQAVADDDITTVTSLLKKGFCLNTCDKAGNNLWHYAFKGSADKASEKVLELLLTLEGTDNGFKKANKAGIPPFAFGLFHHKDFTEQLITTYCKTNLPQPTYKDTILSNCSIQ
ncbi:MAG: WD40 repeat domain-containing protein [Tatlockia sp.]|nr:WD40 repeat domain-containing protein [Tatlockia sp.]